MGRAFEFRKARKFKRWGNMARIFTKLTREIEVAVKDGGPDPSVNSRLRMLIQNARSENMPKDNIERAINRAISKEVGDYKVMVYEGYGPSGIAILVETATDNTTRTVANVRSYFNKGGGTLGTTGSVGFMFSHTAVFKFSAPDSVDIDELELELIDFGVDELLSDEEDNIQIHAPFESYGAVQNYLEEQNFEIKSGEVIYIPLETKQVDESLRAAIDKLIDKLQDDDDVTNVFTTMREEEEE